MYYNPLYCKLVNGDIMVVFSNNTDTETMHVFPVSELEDFDPEYISCTEVPYSSVLITDRNLTVVECY